MQKGRLFERLIKTYFEQDPLYRDRFASVSLWSDWAAGQSGFGSTDIGVDLVAEERAGGFCAVQCKCYAPGTRISKGHLDSFISASARDPFTALRIAECIAGVGGRALYLVPSISLFQQSMREWAEQRAVPHRYVGICSDTRAGRYDEDASLQELEIPVTTDPAAISKALRAVPIDAMTVVFCTYHSLGLVEQAQDGGAPPFDVILCDEAHRITGVERPGDATSPFVLVHDAARLRAKKRLYMTATPRLYTEGGCRIPSNARCLSEGIDVPALDAVLFMSPRSVYRHRDLPCPPDSVGADSGRGHPPQVP